MIPVWLARDNGFGGWIFEFPIKETHSLKFKNLVMGRL
jgi:hypothetical protein